MAYKIETQIFEEPFGNVRGFVTVRLENRRIAHAFIHTNDLPPTITFDKAKKNLTMLEVREIITALSDFADEVQRIQHRNHNIRILWVMNM
jgi:hypothetical protein